MPGAPSALRARACRWTALVCGLGLAGLLTACQSGPERPQPRALDVAAARSAGESAYAASDWRAAEPHYRALVEAVPQDAELWFRLGNIYARIEQPDAAVVAYREALVRDGSLGKAWFNMGVIQLRQAANSFLKMQVHTAAGDPTLARGEAAYAAIMDILGEARDDVSVTPAPDAPAADARTLD